MTDRIKLTYGFDAYCGWCYGFGPAVRAFAAENRDRIDLRVLSGGLFTGSKAQPIGSYPHIPQANKRISELTGVEFGQGYQAVLEAGTRLMDSEDAAAGLIALRREDLSRSVEFAGAIQSAWYLDGADLADVEVYRRLAGELGLDADRVAAAFEDPSARSEAQEDFRELRRLGVDSYPTLLLHTETGDHRLGGPVADAKTLTEALDRHLES